MSAPSTPTQSEATLGYELNFNATRLHGSTSTGSSTIWFSLERELPGGEGTHGLATLSFSFSIH